MEIWKVIEEFPNYSVSNTGKVRSNKSNRCLSLVPDRQGYARVCLRNNPKQVCRIVHRLMAIVFIPNPENKKQVNHIDGNKTNNKLSNLEWVTGTENIRHAVETGLLIGRKGMKHHNTNLCDEDIHNIRKLCETGMKHREIAKLYNISKNHVSRIKRKEKWGHV